MRREGGKGHDAERARWPSGGGEWHNMAGGHLQHQCSPAVTSRPWARSHLATTTVEDVSDSICFSQGWTKGYTESDSTKFRARGVGIARGLHLRGQKLCGIVTRYRMRMLEPSNNRIRGVQCQCLILRMNANNQMGPKGWKLSKHKRSRIRK